MTSKGRFETFVRVLLLLQVALVLFFGAANWLGLEGFSDGGAEARRVTAFAWGFAALLLMAGLRLKQDPRWILPVIATVALNGFESAHEALLLGTGPLQPLVIEAFLGSVYTGYAVRTWRVGGFHQAPGARGLEA